MKTFGKNRKIKNSILLVHDGTDYILSAKRGYNIIKQQRELECLRTFQLNPEQYKMVIIDQKLSHLSGIKLAEEFLQIKPDIPIVLLKSETSREISIREKHMKPAKVLELAKTVKRLLKKNKKLQGVSSSIFLVHG